MTTQSEPTAFQTFLHGATNFFLFFAGLIILCWGTRQAVFGDVKTAVVLLAAGLILLFAATIDRFELLKGLGIEAKTRKLDREIERAKDLTAELQELAQITGSTLISFSTVVGRPGADPSPRELFALAERIRGVLVKVKAEPAAIAEALKPWALTVLRDRFLMSARHIQGAVNHKLDYSQPHTIAVGKPFSEQVIPAFYALTLADFPRKYYQLIDDAPLLNDAEKSALRAHMDPFVNDIAQLRDTLTLPNAEAWMVALDKIWADSKKP